MIRISAAAKIKIKIESGQKRREIASSDTSVHGSDLRARRFKIQPI